MRRLSIWAMVGGLALALLVIACDQNPLDPSKSGIGTIKLSIRKVSPNPLNKTLVQSNAAVISSAQIVIEKIKFKSSLDDSLDFRLPQPFVQDLNALDTLYVLENIPVPFGTYKESEIEIDNLEPEDGQAYLDYPELRGLSIRVTGFVNGDSTQPFVFTSDLSEEQEREFNPPLVIDVNTPSTNVVLLIDMSRWFVDSNGNPLDPRDPANREVIEHNIKSSLEVFEDEDDDGHRDNGDEEDDSVHGSQVG